MKNEDQVEIQYMLTEGTTQCDPIPQDYKEVGLVFIVFPLLAVWLTMLLTSVIHGEKLKTLMHLAIPLAIGIAILQF